MTPPLILSSNENLKIFEEEGFLIKKDEEKYRCICGRALSLNQIKLSGEFYSCPGCSSSRKFSKSNIHIKTTYKINIKNLFISIRKKLKSLGVKQTDGYGKTSLLIGENQIPLGILELPIPSLLDPQSKSLVIYYHDLEYNKIKNTYCEKRLLNLGDFLKLDRKGLELILAHIESLENSNLIKIANKITSFCNIKSYQDFEIEITKLFDNLKDKSVEVEKFLKLLEINKNLFLGRKSVHVGGNHPVDVECIELFDYFNCFFNLDKNFGADTKKYCKSEITGTTIRDKLLSGSGKSFVIITNKSSISKSAWFEVYKAKKNHGNWHVFIFDLDILSLLVFHLNLQDKLFNL